MTFAQTDCDDATLDELVSEMLQKGPDKVPCPRGVSRHDFDSIRLVVDKGIRMYHPRERHVPWQPGLQRGNRGTLMDILRNRDYQGAHGFLAVEADFIAA